MPSLLRNDGKAFGESMGRKPRGWDEVHVGAVGTDASVGMGHVHGLNPPNRRMHAVRGRGSREASSYPK